MKKKKICTMTDLTQKIKNSTGSNWERGIYQDLKKEGHVEDLYVYLMLYGVWCGAVAVTVAVLHSLFSPKFQQVRIRGRSWSRGNCQANSTDSAAMKTEVLPKSEDWEPEYTPKSKKYYLVGSIPVCNLG